MKKQTIEKKIQKYRRKRRNRSENMFIDTLCKYQYDQKNMLKLALTIKPLTVRRVSSSYSTVQMTRTVWRRFIWILQPMARSSVSTPRVGWAMSVWEWKCRVALKTRAIIVSYSPRKFFSLSRSSHRRVVEYSLMTKIDIVMIIGSSC